ncbi:hypothetical protein Adt_33630 [Abeliophyllum distichum]|uniref:Uncharacterized protein n=1 Tax=Abeliophyllum distichum TaxID=126358 RepID=A0ABD1QWS6_9LAMI
MAMQSYTGQYPLFLPGTTQGNIIDQYQPGHTCIVIYGNAKHIGQSDPSFLHGDVCIDMHDGYVAMGSNDQYQPPEPVTQVHGDVGSSSRFAASTSNDDDDAYFNYRLKNWQSSVISWILYRNLVINKFFL